MCLNCSGIHRSMSSRVKSIKLDFWEDELVEVWTVFSYYRYCHSEHIGDAGNRMNYPWTIQISMNYPIRNLALSHLGSSWNPMAMSVHKLCMRKLFQRTTIDLRKMTVCEYFSRMLTLVPELYLAHILMLSSLVIYKHKLLTRQYHRNREKCNYWMEKYIKANELLALLFWPAWDYFDDCCWITVSWESSGFGLNTRGWNSQEKPSIHLFHIPQVTFPHKCKCKYVAVALTCTVHFFTQMQNSATQACSLHSQEVKTGWGDTQCKAFNHVMQT